MRWIEVDDTVWPVDVEGHVQDALRHKSRGWTSQRYAAASAMHAYSYLTDPSLPQYAAIDALKRARKAAAIARADLLAAREELGNQQ